MVDPQPSAEQMKEIHAGTEDVAFLDHDPHDPQITTRLLPASGLLLAVGRGHPWAGKGEISIQQLNEQPFISLPVSHQMHTWSTQFFTHHHVEPDFLGEFPTPVDLVRALNANEAAAFLPAWVIRQNETLRELEIVEAPELRRDLVLAWRTKMPIRPLARAFKNILEEDLPPQF
jgi:DNA-binding transcriptional LysR family regulator